jgi:hypothetical protein
MNLPQEPILLNLQQSQLWDFAGVDALQVAKHLFGEIVDKIAPFQSLETNLNRQPCSLLRLCENNFRFRISGTDAELQQAIRSLDAAQFNVRVWIKSLDWLTAVALPEAIALPLLCQRVTPKPPHRLLGLQQHRAIPGRMDGDSVLLWRHRMLGQSIVELQMAAKAKEAVQAKLICLIASNQDSAASLVSTIE